MEESATRYNEIDEEVDIGKNKRNEIVVKIQRLFCSIYKGCYVEFGSFYKRVDDEAMVLILFLPKKRKEK